MTISIPANRVAAIAAFLTGIASAIAGIESALPSSWADDAAVIVGVLGSIITALHFMTGAQKYDALPPEIKTHPPEVEHARSQTAP